MSNPKTLLQRLDAHAKNPTTLPVFKRDCGDAAVAIREMLQKLEWASADFCNSRAANWVDNPYATVLAKYRGNT